jgi:diketogulonate reductase-like aldo/keto reductase
MPTTSVTTLQLNDGHQIPQLGFGVFLVPPEEAAAAVGHALKTGYRAVDTAAAYRNERGVGEGVRDSGLDRGELFITTKLWNSQQGRAEARQAFEKSLERLGDDYVDLYLIHWPAPGNDRYLETWETLCELHTEGRARSIGVSNFRVSDLERIIEATGVTPAVNQIELHPRFQQSELRAFHAEHGIATESWSPLGRGALLDDETIVGIASRHERTPAQVILRWHLQLGLIVIPKSVTPSRIEENFGVFDFELSDDDMAAIAGLDSPDGRIGPDPGEFNG